MDHIGEIVSLLAAVIGATWALRSKLGDIEKALITHISKTGEQITALTARVIRLEDRKRRLK